MTTTTIIARLIEQGHIGMSCASRIINKENAYLQDIKGLNQRGLITATESVVLLSDAYDMGETCRNGKLWADCTCC